MGRGGRGACKPTKKLLCNLLYWEESKVKPAISFFSSFLLHVCHMEIETDLKYLHDFFIWDSLEKKSFGVNIFVGKKSVEDTSELH